MPPAMDAPISTEGPSGPRDAPEPSVTTAAAALSVGFAAERNALEKTSEASRGVSEASSFSFASSSSSSFALAQGHLGFSSPSKPSARNRRPVTAKPAAVGAATVPTAWSQVSGRTSRTPSSWYRSGEEAVVRKTRSCRLCSAMLKTATPRPVRSPTPHATRSLPVGSSASAEVGDAGGGSGAGFSGAARGGWARGGARARGRATRGANPPTAGTPEGEGARRVARAEARATRRGAAEARGREPDAGVATRRERPAGDRQMAAACIVLARASL